MTGRPMIEQLQDPSINRSLVRLQLLGLAQVLTAHRVPSICHLLPCHRFYPLTIAKILVQDCRRITTITLRHHYLPLTFRPPIVTTSTTAFNQAHSRINGMGILVNTRYLGQAPIKHCITTHSVPTDQHWTTTVITILLTSRILSLEDCPPLRHHHHSLLLVCLSVAWILSGTTIRADTQWETKTHCGRVTTQARSAMIQTSLSR